MFLVPKLHNLDINFYLNIWEGQSLLQMMFTDILQQPSYTFSGENRRKRCVAPDAFRHYERNRLQFT